MGGAIGEEQRARSYSDIGVVAPFFLDYFYKKKICAPFS